MATHIVGERFTRGPRGLPRCRSRADTQPAAFHFGGMKMDTCKRVTGTDETSIAGRFATGWLPLRLLSLDNPGAAWPLNGAMSNRIAGIAATQCAEPSP